MKHKKLASLVLACAMVLGLAGITPVQAANTTSTTVSLTVDSAPYTITIPTSLTVSKTGWNPIDTGIKAEGSSFPENSKLTVSATSQHGWNLYLDATHKIGYTLKAAESDTSATTSWEFTSAELRASGGKTVTAGIAVNDYSSAAPGTYQDVVTFTATVTDLGVAVTGVSLNKASATLTVGGEETLTATVAPENATNKTVTWSSSNTSVATVDNNGKVTAVAAGTANITATSSADSTKSATCAVTVNAAAATTRTVTFNTATDGKTINKDGVTCNKSFDSYNNIFSGGAFSVSSGQFTKIEVTASDASGTGMDRNYNNIEGWSTTSGTTATWTGKSSTVPFGNIMGNSNPVTIVFTIEDNTPAATYSVTLTGGANATASGSTTQSGLSGAMTTVTYTANSGYHFAEFANITSNGITATRTSDTVVTVSGTPTGDASITIPDAVADTPTTYTVTINTTTNGSVSASPTSAAAGAEIALTVTPDSGYELDTLTVKDASNNDVTVTDNKFTMPASNVTVSATFKAASTLTYIEVGKKYSYANLDDVRFYYIPGETYRQAVQNHGTENGSNWKFGEWSATNHTIYYGGNGNGNLYIDGDDAFAPGKGSCELTLDSVVDPNRTYTHDIEIYN